MWIRWIRIRILIRNSAKKKSGLFNVFLGTKLFSSGISCSLFRDVQFNPHQDWQFSAVLENGKVQLWDKRRPDRYRTCEIENRLAKSEIFLL
jgi:hypothetical protein